MSGKRDRFGKVMDIAILGLAALICVLVGGMVVTAGLVAVIELFRLWTIALGIVLYWAINVVWDSL